MIRPHRNTFPSPPRKRGSRTCPWLEQGRPLVASPGFPLSRRAISGAPGSIAQANVADLGEPEAAPLTAGRQTLAAVAAKLIGQRFLSPLGLAKDDRAELAKPPMEGAEDLFPVDYRFFEQFVSGAWHGELVMSSTRDR